MYQEHQALIWRTLIYTRNAAVAARDAVEEARKATTAAELTVAETKRVGEAQTRAYLTVTGGELLVIPEAYPYAVYIKIKNTGQSPASGCQVKCKFMKSINGVWTYTPKKRRVVEDIGYDIGGGIEIEVMLSDPDEGEGINYKDLPTYNVFGIVEYRTIFDDRVNETVFSLSLFGVENIRRTQEMTLVDPAINDRVAGYESIRAPDP